ncbi:MAG: hypothetical protein ACFFAJ_10550 [Candidatus Hodarchaeota archaeon]
MEQIRTQYAIRTVGTSCCNPSINRNKLFDIIEEMNRQGFKYRDLYIDSTYRCGCMCPDRAAVIIFERKA